MGNSKRETPSMALGVKENSKAAKGKKVKMCVNGQSLGEGGDGREVWYLRLATGKHVAIRDTTKHVTLIRIGE